MSEKHPEKCERGNKVRGKFENFREATHRRAERSDILDELDRVESTVSADVKRILREEAEIRLNNSAQETSEALMDWLLLEDELTAYDYEYIQKMGTLLNAVASELLTIAASKTGVSEQNQSTIKQSVKDLLKEIFLRNC